MLNNNKIIIIEKNLRPTSSLSLSCSSKLFIIIGFTYSGHFCTLAHIALLLSIILLPSLFTHNVAKSYIHFNYLFFPLFLLLETNSPVTQGGLELTTYIKIILIFWPSCLYLPECWDLRHNRPTRFIPCWIPNPVLPASICLVSYGFYPSGDSKVKNLAASVLPTMQCAFSYRTHSWWKQSGGHMYESGWDRISYRDTKSKGIAWVHPEAEAQAAFK